GRMLDVFRQGIGIGRFLDVYPLVFDTMPLAGDCDYLGRPVLTLALRSRAAGGNLCARLVDVHTDGTATRVAFGVVNLTHLD
ncbi:CocE/NonD family hydrolase C-terminal non-catalytic domain-containing protein, partial [Rhizobium ruizarguesonis]